MISAVIEGLSQILRGLAATKLLSGRSMDKTLSELAQSVFARSQELVPVDTGYLKSTGHINKVKGGYDIRYSADYAIYVHERYATHASPTQWKFLEVAALEHHLPFSRSLSGLDLTSGLGFRIR